MLIHMFSLTIKVHEPHRRSIMFGVLVLGAVDRGFEPRSGQTKDYKIGICCFSAKHIALRRKRKDWLARNQNNVSQYGATCLPGYCCFNELAL